MSTVKEGQRITGTKDKDYDLISALYHLLEGAATYEVYAGDADRDDDRELVQFFQEIKQQHSQNAERAKELLAKRIG